MAPVKMVGGGTRVASLGRSRDPVKRGWRARVVSKREDERPGFEAGAIRNHQMRDSICNRYTILNQWDLSEGVARLAAMSLPGSRRRVVRGGQHSDRGRGARRLRRGSGVGVHAQRRSVEPGSKLVGTGAAGKATRAGV